ncbi:MAG TPA: type II toxin-antitoxin system VapC family toxin [Burkholderiales bacterium]|nr:type II toxin-antitoxin system VapC family toxin [Burkholderiales bacterium]
MIALDTNVLARYLLKDDPKQASAAAALLKQRENYTAPITVMLELVWVLQANGCSREEVLLGMRTLLGLPNFRPREYEALISALRWFESGMDFADALHLALSLGDEAFRTFDKALIRDATRIVPGLSAAAP